MVPLMRLANDVLRIFLLKVFQFFRAKYLFV